jgi:hypothetical protein
MVGRTTGDTELEVMLFCIKWLSTFSHQPMPAIFYHGENSRSKNGWHGHGMGRSGRTTCDTELDVMFFCRRACCRLSVVLQPSTTMVKMADPKMVTVGMVMAWVGRVARHATPNLVSSGVQLFVRRCSTRATQPTWHATTGDTELEVMFFCIESLSAYPSLPNHANHFWYAKNGTSKSWHGMPARKRDTELEVTDSEVELPGPPKMADRLACHGGEGDRRQRT